MSLIRILHLAVQAGAALVVTATAGAAHSFAVAALLPPGTPQATQDAMRGAFLVASSERDGHADETSDGHLGGLDVFLSFAEPGTVVTADIVVVPLPLAGPDAAKRQAEAAGAALLPAPPTGADAAELLATAADPAVPAFAERFRAATGMEPGAEATALYLAARAVDRAVRAQGGVADRAALAAALLR